MGNEFVCKFHQTQKRIWKLILDDRFDESIPVDNGRRGDDESNSSDFADKSQRRDFGKSDAAEEENQNGSTVGRKGDAGRANCRVSVGGALAGGNGAELRRMMSSEDV